MKTLLLPLLATLLCLPLHAEPEAKARELVRDQAELKQVMHSMIGIRNTLLFYTWGEQKAALRLSIDNKSTKFPVKATLHLFDEATTKEGLAKWLNNQHSDGLFIDAAKPTKSIELPEGVCAVTAHKLIDGGKKSRNGTFGEYEVTVTVKAHEIKGEAKLGAFEQKAKVYVKQVDG